MSATPTLNLPIPTELARTIATLIDDEAYQLTRRAVGLAEAHLVKPDLVACMVEKAEQLGRLANDLRRLQREAV